MPRPCMQYLTLLIKQQLCLMKHSGENPGKKCAAMLLTAIITIKQNIMYGLSAVTLNNILGIGNSLLSFIRCSA